MTIDISKYSVIESHTLRESVIEFWDNEIIYKT